MYESFPHIAQGRPEMRSGIREYRAMVDAVARRRAEPVPALLADTSTPASAKARQRWIEARDVELAKDMVRAAVLILDLLKNGMDVAELRHAVEPESLRDVLLRTGEDYTVLFLIGEGKEEYAQAIEARHGQMEEARAWFDAFQGPLRFLAEKRWKKIQDMEQALAAFDTRERWSKADTLLFRGARQNLQDAVGELRRMHDDWMRAEAERKR